MKHQYIRIFTSIIFLLGSIHVNAGTIYKCKNSEGIIEYKGQPCANNQSEVYKKRTKVKLNKNKLTSEQVFLVHSYMLHEESKVMLSYCEKHDFNFISDFQHNLKRYYDIGKYNIEDGKDFIQKGSRRYPSANLKGYENSTIDDLHMKFKKMSKGSLKSECNERTLFLPMAAANTRNRASGYQEGDLDPEGND
jgi:hypothetical protein